MEGFSEERRTSEANNVAASFSLCLPLLIAFAGLPSSGKSVVAECLAGHASGMGVDPDLIKLVDIDKVRKGLAGKSNTDELDLSHYTPEAKNRVYEELFRQTEAFLQQGKIVMVAATFSNEQWADELARLADRNNSAFVPFVLNVSLEECTKRAEKRYASHSSASDADAGVVMRMAKTAKVPTRWTRIDATHLALEEVIKVVKKHLAKQVPDHPFTKRINEIPFRGSVFLRTRQSQLAKEQI